VFIGVRRRVVRTLYLSLGRAPLSNVGLGHEVVVGPVVEPATELTEVLERGLEQLLAGRRRGVSLVSKDAVAGVVDRVVERPCPVDASALGRELPETAVASVFESVFVDAGEGLVERVGRVTRAPARAAGLDDRGRLAPGARGDVVLVDPGSPPTVRRTFVAGSEVYRAVRPV
jgi:hypothetical protein